MNNVHSLTILRLRPHGTPPPRRHINMDGKKRIRSDAQGAPSTKTSRVSPPPSLTGMAVVELAFLFLDGPADVLRASAACHRWHELATADSVWREKARREGILEKAGVFEVALPSVTGSSSSAAAEEEDEAAGVGLAFYAQVVVLKVWLA